MSTAFWQQDSDRVVLTFVGAPGLSAADVDVVVTQNSLRAGLRSAGTPVCDAALFAAVKTPSAYFGIKTYPSGAAAAVVVLEKARPGDAWPTLFADGAPENASIFQVICAVQAFSAYEASDAGELTFPADAVINVLYQDPSGWWDGYYEGSFGSLPSNFVNVLPERLFFAPFLPTHLTPQHITLFYYFVPVHNNNNRTTED